MRCCFEAIRRLLSRSKTPPIDEVIKSGLVTALVQALSVSVNDWCLIASDGYESMSTIFSSEADLIAHEKIDKWIYLFTARLANNFALFRPWVIRNRWMSEYCFWQQSKVVYCKAKSTSGSHGADVYEFVLYCVCRDTLPWLFKVVSIYGYIKFDTVNKLINCFMGLAIAWKWREVFMLVFCCICCKCYIFRMRKYNSRQHGGLRILYRAQLSRQLP